MPTTNTDPMTDQKTDTPLVSDHNDYLLGTDPNEPDIFAMNDEPYKVEQDEKLFYRVKGPAPTKAKFWTRISAQAACDDLNAAYAAGLAASLVKEGEQPALGLPGDPSGSSLQSSAENGERISAAIPKPTLVGEWISVAERLPKGDERWCLVIADGAMNCAMYEGDGEWSAGFKSWGMPRNIHADEITHWMPLHQPPITNTDK